MRLIAVVYLYLGFANAMAADDVFTHCRAQNPSWYACSKDSDCVVIPNPCGHPLESAHQRFNLETAKCNIRLGAALSCATWKEADGGKTEALCANKQCVAKKVTKK